MNPDLQPHTRDPGILVHIRSQPPLLSLHSFIGIQILRRIVGQNYSSNNAGVRIKTAVMSVPVQFLPSLTSVNPELQLHTRDPCVLVHSCAQPPLFVLHSCISM